MKLWHKRQLTESATQSPSLGVKFTMGLKSKNHIGGTWHKV